MLAFCIGLCVFEQYTVESAYKNTTAMINEAIEYTNAEDYENAGKVCGELRAYWDKKHPYLTAMIDHGMLDDAGTTIYSLEDIAENDSENLYDSLINVKNQIKTVRENQKITFGNIF